MTKKQSDILIEKKLRFSINIITKLLPMHKNSTLTKSTQTSVKNETYQKDQMQQPKEETLQKILQFAASYRTEKLNNDRYIEMILN